MIQLYSPRLPYPDISYIGIAIQEAGYDQRHVGVLFRIDINEAPKLLHLAFHLRLKCETHSKYASEYYWLHCSGFSDDEQLQLAVWFEKVFSINGNHIPYGLAYSSTGYFDQNGVFIKSDKNCGLTCATFIMALFEDFGFPIIDISSWVSRDDDAEWQKRIIASMREDKANHPDLYSDTHIDDQILNIGVAARFRPEEVAASANAFKDEPMTFQVAEPLGKEVLIQMGINSVNSKER
jgi:hypothetical protein